MADDLDTGGATDAASDPVQQVKDSALTQMARDENPANYIAEREARDKEAKGEEVNGEDRAARIRDASPRHGKRLPNVADPQQHLARQWERGFGENG